MSPNSGDARLLLVGPTGWDLAAAHRWPGKVEILDDRGLRLPERFGLRDLLFAFDAEGFVRRAARRLSNSPPDAIVGSDEHLACAVAAALARELDRPGCDPGALLRVQNKHRCRELQRAVAPEAVPAFERLPSRRPEPTLPYPFFVKPLRGTFSILARRIEWPADLAAYFDFPAGAEAAARAILAPYHALAARLAGEPLAADGFIAEAVLPGAPVTVEGFVHDGRVEIFGVADSHYHPGSCSFERFELPSALPAELQGRMEELAARVALGVGLDETLFNIELMVEPDGGRIWVLEVNPRMAYQFADLHERVDGVHTYDLQFALARGERPVVRRGKGPDRVAGSFCLRRFDDPVLAAHPTSQKIAESVRDVPGAAVWLFGEPGHRLPERRFHPSARYALVHAGAPDRAELRRRVDLVVSRLAWRFE